MQYNFQEGLLCGLLMIHDSVSYNSNKNYRPINDPLFKYILENYTPKVEIIMTPHYTYKYYHDVTPFYSNDDILLWKKIQHSDFRMRAQDRGSNYIIKGPGNYAQGVNIHAFDKATNSKTVGSFGMKVWYRDGEPIIGYLSGIRTFATNSVKFHDKQKKVDGKTVYFDTICYPKYAIKDMTITQSAPIGTFEQSYYVSSGKIKKRSITLPEGAVNPATITITYNQGTNLTHPTNYDLMEYDETGRPLPTNPPADWSGNPVIFPNSFEQKTYTVSGEGMRTAPDFSISTGGTSPQVFCELTADEFHKCELELINQQYEKANGKWKVYDIPNFLLPKGFTNKDLPPEIKRTLPTT